MCSRCLCFQDKGSVYEETTKETNTARRSTKGTTDVINQYKLGEVLGRGAFGVVRAATRKGQTYAVKLLSKPRLKKRRVGMRSNALELLSREIAVWKKLNHPNVCNLVEVINDESHDEVYLVSEFIQGGMLLPDKREVEPLEEHLAKSFCRQILLGLQYLHALGIAHRDIKPANILLTERSENGIVKLCDFGVAEMWDRETNDAGSRVNNTVGTMEFFAPEMCREGGDGFDATMCDAWAAGVTLYMMLLGRLPATGDSMDDLFSNIQALEIRMTKQEVLEKYSPDAFELLCGLLTVNVTERWTVDRALACAWMDDESSEDPAATPKTTKKYSFLQVEQISVSEEEVKKAMTPIGLGTVRALSRFNSFRSNNDEEEVEE